MRIFTLLELLVVIGIISILASLMLPALSKAKNAGSMIACLSNMKQVTLAAESYAGDYSVNRVPNLPDGSSSTLAVSINWNHTLQILGYVAFPRGFSTSNIGSMTGAASNVSAIYQCPKQIEAGLLTSTAWRGCHFGTNGYLNGSSWSLKKPISMPSKTCYFTEKVWFMFNYTYPAIDTRSYPYGGPSTAMRHGNKANAIYLDGHGKSLGRLEIPLSDLVSAPESYYFWRSASLTTWK